jgi:hypothetical protein
MNVEIYNVQYIDVYTEYGTFVKSELVKIYIPHDIFY